MEFTIKLDIFNQPMASAEGQSLDAETRDRIEKAIVDAVTVELAEQYINAERVRLALDWALREKLNTLIEGSLAERVGHVLETAKWPVKVGSQYDSCTKEFKLKELVEHKLQQPDRYEREASFLDIIVEKHMRDILNHEFNQVVRKAREKFEKAVMQTMTDALSKVLVKTMFGAVND